MSFSIVGMYVLKWILGPAVPMFYFWQWILSRSLVHGDATLPALLAAGGTLLLLAARSSWRTAVVQRQIGESDPSRWREGADRVFAGRLRAGPVPLVAPASGVECAFYAWQLFSDKVRVNRRPIDFGTSIAPNGVALADAALDGPDGPVPVRGEPFLRDLAFESHSDRASLERLARHLWSGKVELRMLRTEETSLRDIASRTWHAMQHAAPDALGHLRFESIGTQTRSLFGEDLLPWRATRDALDRGEGDAAIMRFADALEQIGARVEECVLPAGAPVVALGRWHRAQGYLTIGPQGKKALVETGLRAIDGPALIRGRWRWSILCAVFALVVASAVHGWAFNLLRGAWTPTTFPREFVTLDGLMAARAGAPDALLPLLGPDDRQDELAAELRARRRAEFEASDFYRVNQLATRTHPDVAREQRVRAAPEPERLRAIDALLALGSIDVNRRTTSGHALLTGARGAALERLLQHGLDVNAPGLTPLHEAAFDADPERVARLLAAGADPMRLDAAGRTALERAEHYARSSKEPREAAFFEQTIALLRAAEASHAGQAVPE